MEAEEKTTPRNRDEAAALGSSVTLLPRSSLSSFATPVPGVSSSTPRTVFNCSSTSSSDKNSVLLSDWWLVKAEREADGKRLAVGGFATRQKATRVFCSAPIIKRYDAYTLETEDGITVIIQGMINKARTHDNGFPPEVCNCFLVGFPYNWDYYADEYFRKNSACSSNSSSSAGFRERSKDSADRAGYTSPVCVRELPVGRICDILISSGGTLSRNFTEGLKKFFGDPSLNLTMQKPSPFPVENSREHEMDKSDQKHENSKGFATVVNHDAERHATGHAEEGVHRNNLHAGDVLEENSNFSHDVSHDSLMHENREIDIQPAAETTSQIETRTTVQREKMLSKSRVVEKDNDLVSSVLVNCDNVDQVSDCIEGSVNAEGRVDSSSVGMMCLLKDSLPKESNLSCLKHDEELGDDAVRRPHCVEILRTSNVGVSDDLLVQKDCDPKNADSLKVKMTVGSENSLDSDVTKPSKASITWEGVTTRSKISSLNEVMVPSTFVSQGDAYSHHIVRTPRDLNKLKSPNIDITRISKDFPSNEIDDMCCNIFKKIESCKFPSAGDPTSQISLAVDMKSTRASEVKESLTNELLTKAVNKGKKKKLQFSVPATQKSADEEKLTGRFSLLGAEELLSTGNVQDDVSYIALRTRSRHRNSSASSEGRPVESSANVKAKSLSTRMSSSKKKGNDNQMAGRSPEDEKIGGSSVPVDHCTVNAADDTRHMSRHKHARDVAEVKVGNGLLEALPMKGDAEALNNGLQPCSVSTPTATGVMHGQGDGHTNDCIGMNDGNENVALKFTTKSTSHLDNLVEDQSGNNKTSSLTGENILNTRKDQDAEKSKVLVMEQPSRAKTLHATKMKAAWRPISSVYQTPNTRSKVHKLSMASPESLNLKRSRSGRLIVPPLANWCQQIIYDADGSIAGIGGVNVLNSPEIGSKSEPVKKGKRFT